MLPADTHLSTTPTGPWETMSTSRTTTRRTFGCGPWSVWRSSGRRPRTRSCAGGLTIRRRSWLSWRPSWPVAWGCRALQMPCWPALSEPRMRSAPPVRRSLARLGDQRVLDLIRRRSHLPWKTGTPGFGWPSSTRTGPETTGILRRLFTGSLPRSGDIASILAKALMVADPGSGISLVVERWRGSQRHCGRRAPPWPAAPVRISWRTGRAPGRYGAEPEATGRLPIGGGLGRSGGSAAAGLPQGHPWTLPRRQVEPGRGRPLPLAEPLASARRDGEAALSLILIRALTERVKRSIAPEKSRDAVRLLLWRWIRSPSREEVRLTLPETLDGQLNGSW
jgi:hypothetical protein